MSRNKNGFSLVELIVSISIVSFLSYVGFISYANSLRRSRDGRRQADLEMIRGALEIYRADNDLYPYAPLVGANYNEMHNTLRTGNYLTISVNDPQAANRYYYYNSPDGRSYRLCAFLERSTTNTCVPGAMCSSTENCNYGVTNP